MGNQCKIEHIGSFLRIFKFPFLSPTQYPATCGTAAVTGVCDITVGYDSTRPPHYKPVRHYPLHTLLGQVKLVLLVTYHYIVVLLLLCYYRYYQLIPVVK